MQTKLTLTLEQDVIQKAKQYAKNKGRSLSELIENYLKIILDENESHIELSPSIKKLKGSIKLPNNFNYKEGLTESLSEKYDL